MDFSVTQSYAASADAVARAYAFAPSCTASWRACPSSARPR